MSPSQYRALERLRDAHPDGLPLDRENGTDRIHHATAHALVRRGLAKLDGRFGTVAVVTVDGLELLARNPEPSAAP